MKTKPIRIASFEELPAGRDAMVFLACFNRLQMAKVALASLLAQNYQGLTIVVSDNSTSNEVENWVMSSTFVREIYYVHWQPTLPPPHEHARRIFQAADRARPNFWQLFHDDDVALPTMIEEMVRAFEGAPEAAAVAPNAIEFRDSRILGLMRQSARNLEIRSGQQMLSQYFEPALGVAPCPGYLYRGRAAQVIRGGLRGGKYMDIWTNCEITRFGPVLWLAEPLMLYRRHGTQDSLGFSVRQRKALFTALVQAGTAEKSGSLRDWFSLQNIRHFNILRVQGRQRNAVGVAQRIYLVLLIRSFMRPRIAGRMLMKIWRNLVPVKIDPETRIGAEALLATSSLVS